LERYGLANRPQVVVWQIAESNDLVEATKFDRWVADGRPRWGWTDDRLALRTKAWKRRSPSYRLFDALRPKPEWPLKGTFLDGRGAVHEVRFLSRPGPRSSPVDHPGWPILDEAIRHGAGLLAERGVALVIVLMPMKLRVMAAAVDLDERTRNALGDDWDHEPDVTLAHALEHLCAELGVVFVDTTPALREHARTEPVYQPLDTHLSMAGHRVVAELVIGALERLEIPRAP
jgi:hypothetical protein